MIKKRAMAEARWVSELATMKRLETGYTDNQPKWPYWVKPHNYSDLEWWAIDDWMVETFGESDWAKTSRWVGGNRKYWFRDEADRMLFLLRWS
jgi:hypothetical protein